MKFKMAAAAVLNLLFYCGRPLRCCKISLIYVNRRPRYCCLCKNLRWLTPPSWIFFVQYFGMREHKTSNVMHMPNFVQICAIVNTLWAIDEIQNGGRRYLEFFCTFWSNGLFLVAVAAFYITAKYHSSTSIGGWVIAICAKIQDGGRRYIGFYFCSIFWHTCM